jgi:hypothetical protein
LSLPAAAAEVRGLITRVDPDRRELVVEGRGRGVRGLALSFELRPDTQVHFGQERGQLAELTPGTRAHVFYETLDGRRIATLITVSGRRPSAPSFAMDPNTVGGVLRRVSPSDREIVVISPSRTGGDEAETTFLVPPEARITKDRNAVGFEDLKEGDPVQVRAEKRDGRLAAQAIHIGAIKPEGDNRIERLRQVLKIVDGLLQLAEQRKQGQP